MAPWTDNFMNDTSGVTGGLGDAIFDNAGDSARKSALAKGGKYAWVGADPYRQGWDSLINQLQQRSRGQNSLAEKQTRDVAAAGMNQQLAMGRGRSAGAARSGALGASQISQGLENSAAQARLAEMNQAQGQLQSALGNAGNQDFQRAAANQGQWWGATNAAAAEPSNTQKLAGMAAQIGGAVAGAGGGGATAKTAAPATGYTQPTPVGAAVSSPTQDPGTSSYAPRTGATGLQAALGTSNGEAMVASPYESDPRYARNPYGARYA